MQAPNGRLPDRREIGTIIIMFHDVHASRTCKEVIGVVKFADMAGSNGKSVDEMGTRR
jgi:hypothetical protein